MKRGSRGSGRREERWGGGGGGALRVKQEAHATAYMIMRATATPE